MILRLQRLFQSSKSFQACSLLGIISLGSICLYNIDRFPLAFLLLMGSLLLLYYTSLPVKIKWLIGAVLLAVVIPLSASGTSSYQSYMELATTICIYVIMALGLNITVGFTGLLDLGYIAFFAIGAYTYGILASPQAKHLFGLAEGLSGTSFWALIFVGAALAFVVGLILGLPVLRVRGDYLAVVTLGFGEITRIVINNLDKPLNITNGAKGIPLIAPPKLFGYNLIQSNHFYFIAIFFLALVIFVVLRLEHSRIGRAWKSIRENEIAAQAMGVPIVKMKLLAFACGACFAGMAGVMYAAKTGFIDPTSFMLVESISILLMVILGGIGSVPGVILGAAMVTTLNYQVLSDLTEFLQTNFDFSLSLSPEKMQKLLFGIMLVCIVRYRPKGFIPAKNRVYDIPVNRSSTLQQKTDIC